ncbi:uncharacterized protein KQ657_000964 [Scheffersomyces spartinae]|uniref:CAP-Gly domain-containing protein n=1 Tax=Scheffersomyces spartinae TaxID=45513 RepID=A0A9P7V8M4_9ASCO|nr:uncharacterized protein KQ657_000964 [Scheffersomyces spartinae]KAG7193204.1 hypothetical protein KQ657_000964 [Scheffersomyces spartinae]
MADINVYVTSDLTSSERRISPQWTTEHLKEKLEHITGIPPQSQELHHYPTHSSNSYKIIGQDPDTTVSAYAIAPYSRIHVLDKNPDSELGALVDDEATGSTSEEFKLTEEEYSKREGSVLQWKQSNKLGRFDPEYVKRKNETLEENESKAKNIKVGDRCRIINIQGERRGEVKFVGKINELDKGENIWVGIEFDEPVGKNDGSIDGTRIFSSRPSHGSFLKPKIVEVGDFPELNPFDNDSEDEL